MTAMDRCDNGALLQCRGPERRMRPIHFLVGAFIIAGFVGGTSLLGWHQPPLAPAHQASLIP
jgi:hypothetical protein